MLVTATMKQDIMMQFSDREMLLQMQEHMHQQTAGIMTQKLLMALDMAFLIQLLIWNMKVIRYLKFQKTAM